MTEKTAGYIRNKTLVERLIARWWFWLLFIGCVFSYPIWRSVHRELPPELPRIFKLSKLNLKTQFNENFELIRLGSRISILHFHDFGCTKCEPILEQMQVIQKRVRGLGSNVALLSVNVNEQFANATELTNRSQKFKSNPFVWKMLFASDHTQLKTLVTESFKGPLANDNGKLIYPEKIYLIDKEGFVRGLYNFESESVNRLMIDVGLLINSAFKPKS